MFPKVFRINKFWQYYALSFSLFTGCVLIGLIYLFLRFGVAGEKLLFIALLPVALFLVIPLILMLYVNWVFWSYRIEFRENELRVSREINLFAPPIRFSYVDIDYVRRPALRGSIQIIPKRGKPFRLRTNVEGGSDALLDELEKHFAQEKFQPYLRAELKKYSVADKVNFILYIPLLVIFLLVWLPRLAILPNTAWETVKRSDIFGSGSINSFWIDNDTIWLSHSNVFSKNSQIIQIENSQEKHWDVSEDWISYSSMILADREGKPWIIDDDLHHWTGSAWQSIPLKSYSIRSFTIPVIIDGSYWASAYQKDKDLFYLVKLDLDSGEISPVYLPGDLARNKFSIREVRKAPDDSLYVMLAKPYNPVYFYSLNDGQWGKKIELSDVEWIKPGRLFDPKSEPILSVQNFTVDNLGRVWAIMNKEDQPRIGRYNSSSGIWEWTSIIEDRCPLCSASYDDIVIDPQGRVWLSANYGHKEDPDDEYGTSDGWGIDVFLPHWGGTAERLQRYTEENSGYHPGFGGSELRISEDGYIWTANERLIRIDANRRELPSPLPDWLAGILDPRSLVKPMLVIVGVGLIWSIVSTLFLRSKELAASSGADS